MHVYIVFAHPSRTSFCSAVLEAFTRGLRDAGHSYEVADLYRMGFQSEMDLEQYEREVGGELDAPVPADVAREQARVDAANALAFIYPVWWSDCPAKLKGWFDRVLSYGYAYSYDADRQRSTRIAIEEALVLCPAGHTVSHLEETGVAEAMRRIMLGDRLLGVGVRRASLEILGGMMPGDDSFRNENLKRAHALGKGLGG
jgi:NAD(P)H dehydrogenase (quinone)